MKVEELNKKKCQLNKISVALKSSTGSGDPQSGMTFILGFFIIFALYISIVGASLYIGSDDLPSGLYVFLFSAFFGLIISHKIIKKLISYDSYEEQVDDYLTEYKPLGVGTFEDLKHSINDLGYMDLSLISDWVDHEKKLIDVAMKRAKTMELGGVKFAK